MRVVTRLTGLTADTIRVWERRYGAVRPERTQGNARRYSSEEIRRLQLLREAISRGHAIGDIGALSNDALERLSESLPTARPEDAPAPPRRGRWAAIVEGYIEAIEQFDLRRADEILTRAAVLVSTRELALEIMAPLLREVGERWQHGAMTVAQEHVVSNQARSLLGTMLRVGGTDPGAPRIVLAAPEGHEHDLGLLIAAVLAASRGIVPIHLGPNVPWAELTGAVARAAAEILVLGIARDLSPTELGRTRAQVSALVERTEIWLGVPPGHAGASLDPRVRVFHSFENVDAALAHRFLRATSG